MAFFSNCHDKLVIIIVIKESQTPTALSLDYVNPSYELDSLKRILPLQIRGRAARLSNKMIRVSHAYFM